MQATIGYPETYEQHMTRLVEGIPHDPRVMVAQIAKFINEYSEFQDAKYAEKLQSLVDHVERNRESHKRKAFEILLEQNRGNPKPTPGHATIEPHPPLFELKFEGSPNQIVLPTYGNPMMTALYGMLFQMFAFFQQDLADEEMVF